MMSAPDTWESHYLCDPCVLLLFQNEEPKSCGKSVCHVVQIVSVEFISKQFVDV